MPSTTASSRLRPLIPAALVLLAVLAGCSAPSQPGAVASPTTPATSSPSRSASGPATTAPGPSATPKSTLPPPATTPVPPSTPGDVNSTVPTRPAESKKPVDLDQPSETGTGATARLIDLKAINAKATIPGEVSGPGVAVTLEVTNTGPKALDVGTVVVTLADSDKAPGTEITSPPAKTLTGSIAPSKSARGVYVFTVPTAKRDPVTVSVTIGAAPALVFEGNAR